MTIKAKIEVAQDALQTIITDATLPDEANFYLQLAHQLLEKILQPGQRQTKYLLGTQEEYQENQITIILSGAIVLALSKAQEDQSQAEKLYYAMTHQQLYDICKVATWPKPKENDSNEYKFIIAVGKKVLSVELAFNVENLSQHLPALSQHIEVIQNRCLKASGENIDANELSFPEKATKEEDLSDSERIRRAFNRCVNYNRNTLLANEHKDKFFDEFEKLIDNTIIEFDAKKIFAFTLTNCLMIAANANTLAKKVLNDSVTQEDCDEFDNSMEPFKESHRVRITINALLGAVAGLILGIVAGYLIPAGVIGLAIGSGLGFFAGGLAAGAYAKHSINKHIPELQMVNAAQRMSR